MSDAVTHPPSRAILHVDMDAFYASVEQLDRPELRGRPVIVGGGSVRGVVAAASYEVRKFGVHSAMPTRQALARCPDAILVAPRMARYREVSAMVFEIFQEFTPQIQGLSLDEAFLDVTASVRLFGSPVVMARAIKTAIRERLGLTASVGVSHNKLLAKIASDLEKPDGLVCIDPVNALQILDPLPIRKLPGIGPKTTRRLEQAGLRTFRDVRSAPAPSLEPIFGRDTPRIRARAMGIDDREVRSDESEKQISAEITFETDLTHRAALDAELARLADRVGDRLRRRRLATICVSVKIRTHDFKTVTRSRTFQPATENTGTILKVARGLLHEWYATNSHAVRLIGISLGSLSEAEQLDLFTTADCAVSLDRMTPASKAIDPTLDRIRQKFGVSAVQRASTLDRPLAADGFRDAKRR